MRPFSATVLLLAVSAVSAAEPVPDDVGQPADSWEDLGVPVRRARIFSSTIGRDTAGKETLYLGFGMHEALVLALDPRTGNGCQLDLPGSLGTAWGLCAHSNGKAYVSNSAAGVFELDAVTRTVSFVDLPPDGEQVVWELFEAEDGHMYGGTYPGAELVRVNVPTRTTEDLGSMDPTQMYVRTIATDGEYVYCGCGVTKPSVWAYHIPTGEKTQLLPDDARTGKGWGRAMKREDGGVYIWADRRMDHCYRVRGLAIEKVEELPHLPYLDLSDGARIYLSHRSGPEGVFWLVEPGGERREIRFDYSAHGTPIWSLFDGPDGRVYGTTYTPISLFSIEPEAGAVEVYGDPVGHAGQVYATLWHEGRLHMTAYSESSYTIWDPKRPWSFGKSPESNPRRIGDTTRHVHRAGDMMLAPDGRHVFVVGAPGYGMIGGGLCIADPEEATFEVVEQPVAPQSPWRLVATPDPDVVIIGTTMYNSTGTERVFTPGRLVFWNWREKRVVRELTPWPDVGVINSLLRLGDELFVCGAAGGKVAVYSFSKGDIVFRSEYAYGNGVLRFREADGKIYAAMKGQVVRIDPATRSAEIIGSYPGLTPGIALAGKHLYGFKKSRLLRFRLD